MDWRPDAIAHTQRDYPREACGLVVAVGNKARYFACRNTAQGDDHFVMHPEDYAAAEDAGKVLAVFHSHPNASCHPSDADRVACEASGVPWHVLGWPSGLWGGCEPCGFKLPLVGRQFSHGITDCWSCVRDGLRELAGIEVQDFARTDDWWLRGENLYMDNFERAGFARVIGEPQMFDVILMQIHAKVANHAALYLGGGTMLHHLHGRLSCKDIYGGRRDGGFWRRNTVAIVRHLSLMGK